MSDQLVVLRVEIPDATLFRWDVNARGKLKVFLNVKADFILSIRLGVCVNDLWFVDVPDD